MCPFSKIHALSAANLGLEPNNEILVSNAFYRGVGVVITFGQDTGHVLQSQRGQLKGSLVAFPQSVEGPAQLRGGLKDGGCALVPYIAPEHLMQRQLGLASET